METAAARPKKKVAVLGGGVGAMAAAFALSDLPGAQDDYEITVYQLGWRLGGKGASSRNPERGYRIEEHGLHLWMGFYDNAFRLMRRCYALLNRPQGHPLRTVEDAFQPHSYGVLEERLGDRYSGIATVFPPAPGAPGVAPSDYDVWEYVPRLLQWMLSVLTNSPAAPERLKLHPAGAVPPPQAPSLLARLDQRLHQDAHHVAHILRHDAAALAAWADEHGLHMALALTKRLAKLPAELRTQADRTVVVACLDRLHQWLRRTLDPSTFESDPAHRRLFIALDAGIAALRGIFADGVLTHGFDAINGYDLLDWLERNGASKEHTTSSRLLQIPYELVFAYEAGDPTRPRAAAGTMLRAIMRMAFFYKGALSFKMMGGMADVVFTPLYEALKQRGVRFRFFRRVKALELAPDQPAVERIRIGRQVKLVGEDQNPDLEYAPLYPTPTAGLHGWPNEPLYDQLHDGEAIRAAGADFESKWCAWPEADDLVLQRGRDFDSVILGIPVGGLQEICAELGRASPLWADMLEHVKTVRTQALQLWLRPSLLELGWNIFPPPVSPLRRPAAPPTFLPDPPSLGGYRDPFNTYMEMSHLLPREAWPAGDAPRSIAYFCGPMPDDPSEPGPDAHDYPRTQLAATRAAALDLLEHIGHLWPKAVQPGTDELDWSLLVPPGALGGQGRAALDQQFFRANIDPSERYVLSLPGTIHYRLRADHSGFENLFLAGDWTKTGLDAGCVEAAVMSALGAVRGLSGTPIRISGETDFGRFAGPAAGEDLLPGEAAEHE